MRVLDHNLNGTVESVLDLQLPGHFDAIVFTVHTMFTAIICVVGIICDFIGVLVLTKQSSMSPTCVFLTGLAVSDGMSAMLYVLFIQLLARKHDATLKHLTRDRQMMALSYIIVHALAVSTWLRLALMFYMYAVLNHWFTPTHHITLHKAKQMVTIVLAMVTLFFLPNYTSSSIPRSLNVHHLTLWTIGIRNVAQNPQPVLVLNLWLQVIVMKLLPSALYIIFTILIVMKLKVGKRILHHCIENATDPVSANKGLRGIAKIQIIINHLLFITCFCVLSLAPNGILLSLTSLGTSYNHLYNELGHFFSLNVLFCNTVSFLLYCTMSTHFRMFFTKFFMSFKMPCPN